MPPQPWWTLPSQKHIQDCITKFNIPETFPNIFSKRLSILSLTLSVNPFEVISMNNIGRNPGFLMVCYAGKLGSLPSCCSFSNTSSLKNQRQGNHFSQKLPPRNKIYLWGFHPWCFDYIYPFSQTPPISTPNFIPNSISILPGVWTQRQEKSQMVSHKTFSCHHLGSFLLSL